MARVDVVRGIEESGVVAVVRLDDLSDAVNVAKALAAGGVRGVEYTFTNPKAAEAIAAAREVLGDEVLVGAGSVLDGETARIAILAGAQFVVTPTTRVETIQLCTRYAIPVMSGAFTPTEILTAWEAGASMVKVFPASVGGPGYLKDVLGPLPQIKLIPTGGVSADNAGAFIAAGARAVALGSSLVDPKLVAAGAWSELTARAQAVSDAVAAARS
ncbi:MAG TPA: bifunctional 4-hydroxy-2-oxoglutarate aldolase/2-dehydro-3-deoxy-phosphogluconate aldolase [Thermomicrobiales bacterium]|jgi:2-dehydro-3-deoxyphosphogluconate aldolase/(4S)-4-hydroxy-2-oxoglutarate aldolase|nr:bifunctional 4-hydroxy-2-oxoglutarate aldolase/2-dehydro-3-deoxy-phosphogluconate aldolase [Thermomicrobiales bacterium]